MGITLDSLDEIKIVDSGGDELLINGDGSLNAVISATDLDIRDLINTQDSIAIGDETTLVDMAVMDSAFGVTSAGFPIMGIRQDASGSPVSADGDAHPLVFNNDGELKVVADVSLVTDADDAASVENPLSVGGVSADTATALGALSAAADRFHLLGDLYRRVFTNDSHNVAWKNTRVSVGLTESEVAATPLLGRKEVIIQNLSNNNVYLKEATGVLTTNGINIPKKSSMHFKFGEALNLFLIADAASSAVNVLEAA